MKTFGAQLVECLNCGEVELKAYANLKTGRIEPDEIKTKFISGNANRNGKAHIQLRYEVGLHEDLDIELCASHIICRRTSRNVSDEVIDLIETGIELSGIKFGGQAADDYFYHVENPRIYSKLVMPLDMRRTEEDVEDSGFDSIAGNRWADPGVVSERIGASPYQPFPAVLLSNVKTNNGLVHGSLSQQVFFHNYLVEHRGNAVCLDIFGGFKAIDALALAPGRVLEDVWYLGRTDQADDFEMMFDAYSKVLREHLPPLWGATAINRRSLVWGSWNDGIFRDIDQERLLQVAGFLFENCPTVEWMQIDDGYARHSDEIKTAHGLGMPYEGEAGVADYKFPEGLKGFTDKVKEQGLRPAVWIGGHVPKTAKLALEHPDWGADYDFRIPGRMVLDVSRPEVRKYMTDALDFFFQTSGFEGMKHDFWSYAFEDSHDLLANKEHSGYEWRAWWLKEVRKRIPDDAYLQTGCDIVMANPFLAQYFTNYRYGIDIGGGNWDYVKTNFLWGMACFGLHIGDLFVPNSDSVGMFPGLTDAEALLCLNYCLITRSMVEVAGWLQNETDNPRMKWFKKAICCPNNGQNVYFADFDYRRTDNAPEIWYLKTPHFSLEEDQPGLSLRTVAVFNLADEARNFEINFSSLGLSEEDYAVTNIWTNATCRKADSINVTLQAHESALFGISACDVPQLLDADTKVDTLYFDGEDMNIALAHAGNFCLTLSDEPTAVNGVQQFSLTAGDGNFILSGNIENPATIKLKYQ